MASGPSRKRPADDIDDYSMLDAELEATNLHGVVRNLSPVKRGKKANYFAIEMSDGTCRIRFIGFKAEQHKKLQELSKGDSSIEIKDCQIKMSRQGHRMEALLKGASKITTSPKSFNLDNDRDGKPMSINDAMNLPEYTRVTVVVKVLSKGQSVEIGNKKKQDVLVADNSGSIAVTLWEERIDSLEQNKSYKLSEFLVREFNMTKSLSLSRQGAIELVDDIGEVVKARENDELKEVSFLSDAIILAVEELVTFIACPKCGNGRVDPLTPPNGRCSFLDCGVIVRVDRCDNQISAKLLFGSRNAAKKSLFVYGEMINKLTNVHPHNVTAQDFLNTNTFSRIDFQNNVISAVVKNTDFESEV